MRTNSLGQSGLAVSDVAFGTAPLGGLFGPLDEGDAIRTVHEVLDLGITCIDTSPYYGTAEDRLGKALAGGRRDGIVLATKAGRNGFGEFDFSPRQIRRSLEDSLRRLRTDHVDVFQLHDVEFVPLQPVLEESVPELVRMREEGLVRAIGVTGYPPATIIRFLETGMLDVSLTYAHGTLLDDTLSTRVLPVAEANGVAMFNAAAVSLGLLTPGPPTIEIEHPATAVIRAAAAEMRRLCEQRGVDIAFLANQYAIQRGGGVSTVVGTRSVAHVRSAVEAAEAPLDLELLDEVLALRPPADLRTWPSGLPENN